MSNEYLTCIMSSTQGTGVRKLQTRSSKNVVITTGFLQVNYEMVQLSENQ
jgi:hypothetical protein